METHSPALPMPTVRRKSNFDGVVTESPGATPQAAELQAFGSTEPVEPERPPLPFNNALLQNELPSFQATLSPPGVISWLLLCALFCIVLGAIIVDESDKIFEHRVSYGELHRYKYPRNEEEANASRLNGGVAFDDEFGGVQYQGRLTELTFDVPRRVEPPIYLSYTVKGMLMTYRQFASSRSSIQLQGDSLGVADLVKCRPLRSPGELGDEDSIARRTITIGDASRLYGDMIYFPCGALPWSMFNDSISLFRVDSGVRDVLVCNASDFDINGDRLTLSAAQNPCTKRNIAWPSDRKRRFLPSEAQYDRIDYWSGRGRQNTSDMYLERGWYYGEPGHKVPDPHDEDLMVWLRIAGIPDFRKTLRVIHTPLEQGTYRLVVREFFDATSFKNGNKGIELRSASWLGGKNYTLGGILIGGGTLSLLTAIVLFARANLATAVDVDDEEDADELPPAAR